jgi:enoyl-CoA hydratase/carnithine racemase
VEKSLMSEAPVLAEELVSSTGKRVAHLTLNLEKTLNSLNQEMVDILLERLTAWRDDEAIACVFIDAVGDKAFCAGGDVQMLHASSTANPGGPCEEAESFFEREYRMNFLMHTFPKPIICWGHGIVMGGGLGVMAASSHKVATATTRIAMPEITIALFPDVGGSYFLNRMPGESGMFLALTAASINAADALYGGLADFFIGDENRSAVLEDLLAADWSDGDKNNQLVATETLQRLDGHSEQALPPGKLESHMGVINSVCSRATIGETIDAIAELDSEDKWLARARAGLLGGSPLAALWIHRQLRESAGKDLVEVFQSELCLATNIMRDAEFGEGVRALLIDKDKNPGWQFADWRAVSSDVLDSFFKEPWDVNPLADLHQASVNP